MDTGDALNPDLHPRGRDGEFIETFGWVNLRHLALPPRGDEPFQTVEGVTEYDEAPMGRPGVRENRVLDNVRGKVVGIEPDPNHRGVPFVRVAITNPDGTTEVVTAHPYNLEEAPPLKGRLGEPIADDVVEAFEQLEDARKDAVLLGDPQLVAQIDAELGRLRQYQNRRLAASAGDWKKALTAAVSWRDWNPGLDFDPSLHPRGRDGRFIEKWGWVDVFSPQFGPNKPVRGQVVGFSKTADGRPFARIKTDDPRIEQYGWGRKEKGVFEAPPYEIVTIDQPKATLSGPDHRGGNPGGTGLPRR